MKKKIVVLLGIGMFLMPTWALACCPCTAGWSACLANGGTAAACDAGWNACMSAMYPSFQE